MKTKRISRIFISLMLIAVMSVTSIVSVNAAATNTGARIYSDFTKAPAYKNYSAFKSRYVASYSSIVPGMKNTNVNGKNCTSMVPQGICIAKNYMLISAYDSQGTYNSVIYVLSNSNPKARKFVCTLVLPCKSHVGGMAFDGSYVWVSNDKKAASIKYTTLVSKINSAKANANKSLSVAFTTNVTVKTTASFMTYYDGRLWVGEFKDKGAGDGKMYAYAISSDRKKLTAKNYMTVPDRTQGACFKDGYLVLSRSYSRKPTSSTYISQVRVYKPSFSTPRASDNLIYKNDAKKVHTMPPMIEGLAVDGTYMYSIYESCSKKYYTGAYGGGKCPAPIDRVIAFKFANVLK